MNIQIMKKIIYLFGRYSTAVNKVARDFAPSAIMETELFP